jgi:hypothetical protein
VIGLPDAQRSRRAGGDSALTPGRAQPMSRASPRRVSNSPESATVTCGRSAVPAVSTRVR